MDEDNPPEHFSHTHVKDGELILKKPGPPGSFGRGKEINVTRLLTPGPRYTENGEILAIEEQMREGGKTLSNPALPIDLHAQYGRLDEIEDVEYLRKWVDIVARADEAYIRTIGRLNKRISQLQNDAEEGGE